MKETNKAELVITRVFDAPKALIFEAFTKEEHLQHWWGPVGFKLDVISFDFKVNGKFHYRMKSDDGYEMYGIFHYKEIEIPEKIVFTNSFADEKGNIVKAPIEGDFPLEILNTWTFSESEGKTTLTLRGIPLAKNEEQTKAFAALHSDMNVGFNKTIDALESYMSAKFKIHKQLKTNKMARVSTYLNFPGTTEQAMTFYTQVFQTEFIGGSITRFGEIPPQDGMPPLSEADKKLVLHAEVEILGGHVIMATDAPESFGMTVSYGNNMHINLEPDSREESKRLFEALSEGGKITMELQDMFWGAYYGSFTDKYGINWMVNCTETK